MSVEERENITPIILPHTITIWICTRLQHVIAAENSTACEDHESTRRAGAKNVILLPENVNRMMGLWIRFTPTVFTSPMLSISVLETFLASQVFVWFFFFFKLYLKLSFSFFQEILNIRVYFADFFFLSFTGERHSVEPGWRQGYLLSNDSVPLFPQSFG